MSFVDSFEQSNKRRAERRLWWKNRGINVVSVILSVALTLLAAFRFPGVWLWLWFFLLALVIIGTFIKEIVTFRNDRDFAALVKEYQGLRDYKETTTQAVTELLEDLGRRICEALNINNEHTRITFYGHSTKGFVPLASKKSRTNPQRVINDRNSKCPKCPFVDAREASRGTVPYRGQEPHESAAIPHRNF